MRLFSLTGNELAANLGYATTAQPTYSYENVYRQQQPYYAPAYSAAPPTSVPAYFSTPTTVDFHSQPQSVHVDGVAIGALEQVQNVKYSPRNFLSFSKSCHQAMRLLWRPRKCQR